VTGDGGCEDDWTRTTVKTPNGVVPAIAPEVISASRATDIPAFFANEFMQRLRAGFIEWTNPFNRRVQLVSFERTRAIVFWSKNPAPLMEHFDEIDRRGIGYYVQFTLNDYEAEGLEPGVPPLSERIDTFCALSRRLGPKRVIWRFDPLLLSSHLDVDELLRRVQWVGDQIAATTSRLVFSFLDIAAYRRVGPRLRRHDPSLREFTWEEMDEAAEGIAALCRGWGLPAFACAEPIDLARHGIQPSRCIDGDLITALIGEDPDLGRLPGTSSPSEFSLRTPSAERAVRRVDPGQRRLCQCAPSKDIGGYRTCRHGCLYCYAGSA
jgi:hypothetical protein